jgi:fibronectin-binding autotransporter adhesin
MAGNLTRINNNQISDASAGNVYLGITASSKLQNYTITSTKLANNLTYGSDLTITGNLTVQGTTTAVNTVNTIIADPLIVLADGQTSGSPTVDIGYVGLRGSQNSAAFVWKESQSEFVTALTTTDVGGTSLSNTTITLTAYANLHSGNTIHQGTTSLVGNVVGAANFTANITGGNVLTPGIMSATGNMYASYFVGNVSATSISTSGNITGGNLLTGGLISAAGTATVGNVATGGTVSATGNVTGGNVLTAGIVSATANVTGGNVLTAGLISATSTITSAANITGGNILTGGLISATGNATAGNITTAGQVSATANVTGGNILTGGLMSSTGNATHGNILTGGLISATGTITSAANVIGANLTTTGLVTATGNITGGNVLTAGLISATGTITSAANVIGGNLTTAGQVSATANITGGNVLTPGLISATGTITSAANITGGNILTGGLISATGNITTAGTVNTAAVRGTSGITISTGSGNINLSPTTGNIIVNNTYINGISQPVQDNDAASKIYVDNLVSTQINYHQAVYAATTANLATTTGGTITYTQPNGVSNGIGAYLQTTGSFNLIDTANVQTVGTRVLVKNEGNGAYNGVYTWSNATTIVRSTDTDEYGPNSAEQLSLNDYFFVTNGNVNAGSAYIVSSPTGTITFGTSNIQFSQFSSSQTYTGGNGISISGTVIAAKVDQNTTAFDGGGNIIVKASANLTTPNIGAATGTSLSVTGAVNAGTTVSATGNVTGGNVNTGGLISATGTITSAANITGGNILTGGLISAAGNITANPSSFFIGNGSQLTGVTATSAGFPITSGTTNINAVASGNINFTIGGTANIVTVASTGAYTTGVVSATGNITGGNILTAGLISATGTITSAANITGGNILTAGLISSTGTITSAANITGGNILTGGLMSSTGNATHGNILTGGLISATANITGGNILTNGIVSALGNITTANTLTAAGTTATGVLAGVFGPANVALHANSVITAAGNSNASAQFAFQNNNNGSNASSDIAVYNNLGTDTTYFIDMGITSSGFNGTAYAANIYGANDGYVYVVGNSATGPVGSGANIGNLILGSTNGQVIVFVGNASTSNAVTVTGPTGLSVTGAITTTGNANIANATFFVNSSTNTASFGNSTQTTNAIVAFNATNSVLMPVGNTTQRPGTGVTGMLRFNSTLNAMEVYNNTTWQTVGQQTFTVIADDQFTGNGVATTFTLSSSQTTNSCIVSINGVVQIPTTAYSVSGTTLTFTEAPAIGDLIDVRELTTTTTVTSLSSGNTAITLDGTNINITGNFNPTANVTYTLGNNTNRWSNLFLSGTTIYLGDLQLKATNSSTFAVYQSDGTTLANVSASGLSVTSITDGTSAYGFSGVNGNAVITVGGSNIIAVTSGGINNLQANGVGNIGTATSYFNTVFAKATSAQYADLAEKYTADAAYVPGTVLVFGGTAEVTVNAEDADRRVAGVVSTNPSYIMNAGLEGEFVATVALTGRVPTLVIGPVRKGDMLVAAGLGRARAEADPKVGTVIGKALENFDGAEGTIEVVVGRF